MSAASHRRASGQLGTFGGVFTPSVLTILGIILFRRLGYVVGSAGLTRALLMLGLASLISLLTSVSLSAIATNRKVKGGGDYYLISRSLGVEYGGALGLILFVAQAISVARPTSRRSAQVHPSGRGSSSSMRAPASRAPACVASSCS